MYSIQEYVEKELTIEGVQTYIISPVHYKKILNDDELLEFLGIKGNDHVQNIISYQIQYAENINVIKIGFAFVYHSERKIFKWEPVNVCEYKGYYYHVFIRNSWMCRECRHIHKGIIIMPMAETGACFLPKPFCYNFKIPDLFSKKTCESCGHILQNHLLILHQDFTPIKPE